MLLDEVTINDGGGCPAGFCAAAISVVNSIAGMPSKAIVASWPHQLFLQLYNKTNAALPCSM